MSDQDKPVRRRRIAGEAPPAAPAATTPPKRVARKPVGPRPVPAGGGDATATPGAKKTPSAKKAPVGRKTPSAKKAPGDQADAAIASPPQTTAAAAPAPAPAARRPAVSRPAPKVPTRSAASAERSTDVEGPASRPARRDLLWLVPATLVALASLVVGVFLVVNPPGGSDDLETTDRQASSAAASAAETIFSYRFDELDQHLTASKALMTPTFAKEFDKIAPALTELAPQRKIVVEAAAREAAALPCGDDCSSDKAEVLVFVDQARLVGDATQPTVFANRIKVSMVKGDDGWRVANIRAL